MDFIPLTFYDVAMNRATKIITCLLVAGVIALPSASYANAKNKRIQVTTVVTNTSFSNSLVPRLGCVPFVINYRLHNKNHTYKSKTTCKGNAQQLGTKILKMNKDSQDVEVLVQSVPHNTTGQWSSCDPTFTGSKRDSGWKNDDRATKYLFAVHCVQT